MVHYFKWTGGPEEAEEAVVPMEDGETVAGLLRWYFEGVEDRAAARIALKSIGAEGTLPRVQVESKLRL